MRILALDLDDTLAAVNKAASFEALELLRDVSATGCQVMLISGKPAAYLAGFARQTGIAAPIVAGENGAVLLGSPDFPPPWEHTIAISPEARSWLDGVAADIAGRWGDSAWIQPNRVNVSVFWRTGAAREEVIAAVAGHMARGGTAAGFRSFVHVDCAEIVAPGADKGAALRLVLDRLGIDAADAVAVGDSSNDLPMFAVAGTSIGLRTDAGDERFETIEDALRSLLTR